MMILSKWILEFFHSVPFPAACISMHTVLQWHNLQLLTTHAVATGTSAQREDCPVSVSLTFFRKIEAGILVRNEFIQWQTQSHAQRTQVFRIRKWL